MHVERWKNRIFSCSLAITLTTQWDVFISDTNSSRLFLTDSKPEISSKTEIKTIYSNGFNFKSTPSRSLDKGTDRRTTKYSFFVYLMFLMFKY